MTTPKETLERTRGAPQALLIAAAVVLIVAGLRAAATIIVPFLLAFFLACVALPLLNFLKERKVPTALAVPITIIAVLAALFGVGVLLTSSVNEFRQELPKYRDRLAQVNESVRTSAEPALQWLRERGVDVPESLATPEPPLDSEGSFDDAAQGSEVAPWFINLFDVNAVLDQGIRAVSAVAIAVSNGLVVVLILTFILLEAAAFPRKLRVAFGGVGAERRFGTMMIDLRRYLGMKTVISLATGGLIAAWLALLGVDFALLWGFVAFGLNFVPNLGSILAAIPTTLLALLQLGFFYAVLVAVGYLVVNMVLGNLVEPLLLGQRLGLSPLVVLLSLVFWGWVWGPVGMLLSVPLTMVVKIMLENTEDLQWIAVLLGDEASAQRVRAETGALRVARKRRN